MLSPEFVYGLISGVLATLIGFLFAVSWDLWKEKRRRNEERRRSIRLLKHEIAANSQILDDNEETLERDSRAAEEGKEVLRSLSLLYTRYGNQRA